MRWYSTGDLRKDVPVAPYRGDPEQRFWLKVDKNGPVPAHAPELGVCWEWGFPRFRLGYGLFKYQQRNHGAHRWIYEHLVGPVPDGLELDHKCRNRACVRVEHLEPVSHSENMRRAALLRASCKSGRHPFTAQNICTAPDGTRRCRVCRDERYAAWRAARKAVPINDRSGK